MFVLVCRLGRVVHAVDLASSLVRPGVERAPGSVFGRLLIGGRGCIMQFGSGVEASLLSAGVKASALLTL